MRHTVFAASVRGLGLLGVLVSGAACGSSMPSSNGTTTGTATGANNSAYCDDLKALNGNVDQLQALKSGNPSADQVKAVLTDAQNNLNQAAQDASGLASLKLTAVKTTYSALVSAFDAVPTSLSGNEAFQQVQPEITALVAALKTATSGTGCPST